MKKVIIASLIAFGLIGCGGGSDSAETKVSSKSYDLWEYLIPKEDVSFPISMRYDSNETNYIFSDVSTYTYDVIDENNAVFNETYYTKQAYTIEEINTDESTYIRFVYQDMNISELCKIKSVDDINLVVECNYNSVNIQASYRKFYGFMKVINSDGNTTITRYR